MALPTILSIGKNDLSALAPEQGVLLFRELLSAEAGISGIPKSCVSVPGEIFEPDGGIDAEVNASPCDSRQGIIRTGLTSYQIKTGKSELTNSTTISNILFKKKSKELKPEVRKCLDNFGTLTIVHFGWDGPQSKVRKVIAEIKKRVASVDKTYKNARITLIPQNQIITFLGLYPSLALRVTGKAEAMFRTHQGWTSEAEMKRRYMPERGLRKVGQCDKW